MDASKPVADTDALLQGDNAALSNPNPSASGNQKSFLTGGEDKSQKASQGNEGEGNSCFLDVENAPNTLNNVGFVPIRAHISDDVDEDYEGDIEEEASYASTGSYDSVSEHMGAASITDIASPVRSFVEPFSVSGSASNVQKGALRQLNELKTGFASLDTSLLENTDAEGFRNQVLDIVKAKSISPGDDVIDSILGTLLPMVGERVKGNRSTGDEGMLARVDFTRVMPVAKPTVEDDDETDGMDDEELGRSQVDENDLLHSAWGLRVRGSDEEGQEKSPRMSPPFTVRAGFSSDQEDNPAGPSLLESANAEQSLKDSLLQENHELALKAEERDPILVSSLHDLSAGVEHQIRGSKASNTIEDHKEGEPGKGEQDVEIEDSLESVAQSTSSLQQVMSGDSQTQVRESADSELEQPATKNLSMALTLDSLNGDVSSKAWSFDFPASGAIESGSSVDAKLNDIVQNLEDVQESETGSRTSQTYLQSMNQEMNGVPAEGKGNLEEESKILVNTSRGDLGKRELEVKEYDDKGKSGMAADGSLAVAESVSSKSTADPTSDTPSLGGAGPTLAVRPFGLGRSMPPLDHAPRAVQHSSGPSGSLSSSMEREDSEPNSDPPEGNQDAREKLQGIRIKFLRLVHRLGQPPHNAVVAQVLYRLGLAEQLRGGRGTGRPGAFSLERASVQAEEQEAMGQDDLDFECTIMLLGKSGVGKSATINSLFDGPKAGTNAFSPATKKVQVVTGMVHGIKLRIIDTPGLFSSFADQRHNRRIMASVKRFIKKSPPDIVLYVERLDMQIRDYGDLPLLQTITDTFGAAVWFNAIVAFTHAASAPPDGANGLPINYDMFVAQRSHVLQQTIRQAAGDIRLMNPVSLIENHTACRMNRAGQRVLPNGHVWKSQLLLLCFASKILAEANSLLKLQDSTPVKPFGARSRGPPLPYLLSSLLQSRAQLRLPDEQGGEDGDSDIESEDNEADSDGEEEYDDLPPFRRLTREELKLLDKEQRRLYLEELEDRERLFMKKQLKEEQERRKVRKRRMAARSKESPEFAGDQNEEEDASAAVPIVMPDMALPPSFDSDNPTYRYRYLDTANQWLVRPVLETHGWDHDSGYDGLNVEKMFVISQRIPALISGQVTKDKKEANLQMECAASLRSGDDKVTLAGLDIQTIGRDLAYTVRSETRFSNFKRNKTTCGLAVTKLGDAIAAGMKIEDRLMVGKRFKVLVNGGALTGRGDVAYGGSLEAAIRGKDYPVDRSSSSFGLSIMNWHGDLAIGGNLQIQVQLGKTLCTCRANLNNRGAGQISIRANSSEQVQMVLVGLIPVVRAFINNVILNVNGSAR